jgi:hypothetical protein
MKSLVPFFVTFSIFLLYFLYRGLKRYRELAGNKTAPLHIPQDWEKINVDISQCEIVSRVYYENKEIDESPTIRKLLDSINSKGELKESVLSIAIYKHKFSDGQVSTFRSEPIKADEVTVRNKMGNATAISLYVDPSNRSNYLFTVS